MKSKNEKLLIFDCDGVLVDSESLAGRVFVECLQKDGFDVDELYGSKFVGRAFKDCLTIIEKDFERTVSEGFAGMLSLMTHEEIKRSLKPIPNIKEALLKLLSPKCIASGSDHARLRLSLEVTGLSPFFEHIFSATEVSKGKPYPDVFLLAAERLHYNIEDCIVIEDSYAGMQAGLAAGMKVLLYNPEHHTDFEIPEVVTVFDDMSHLPALIK